MPGNSGGGGENGCGSALIAGLALGAIFTLLLLNSQNASVTTGASTSQGISGPVGTSTPPINDGSSLVAFQITPTPARSVVHVFGTPQTTSLNPNLSPTPTCSNGQSISAWVPGYYILTFRCIDNPRSRYDVGLEAVPTGLPVMNETLGTSSAISCYGCHNGSLSPSINEYDDWIKDGHSQVFTAPYFRTTYLGTDINGRQSQQIQWNIFPSGQQIYPLIDVMQPDYGGGYHLDYPARNGNCAVCHVPAGFPETLQEANLANLINSSRGTFINAAAEGITCDICHKVTDVLVDKNSKLPYDDRPGILSMSMARSNLNQQLTFGPLAYQSVLDPPNINVNIKRACYPVYSESKFCAACHYGKFANTLIYGSYKEWLDSNYSKKGTASYRTCQDCHMSGEAQSGHPHLAEHDACSAANPELQNFNHNMMYYGQDPTNSSRTIPLLIRDAAQIKIEPVLTGGQIQLKVTVQSVGVGHKFPTDSPLRHLILLIDARDWRNNRLVQSGGPRVPVWAVSDYGGYPGQIFANILKDKDTNLAPTFAYWNPVEAAWDGADTRLVPGVPVQNVYSFAAPYENSAKITAKLIYRRAFKNVVDQKNWPMENVDVQVTQTVMECNGFGADPQTITCNVVTPAPTATP